MVNIAKQNQYVEFAEKDSKGRNIADKLDKAAYLNDGSLSINILTSENDEISAQKPVVEVMTGYSFTKLTNDHEWNARYAGVAKNGNKLSIVIFGSIVISNTDTGNADFANFTIPADVLSKLFSYSIGGVSILENKNIPMQAAAYDITQLPLLIVKSSTGITFRLGKLQTLAQYGAGTYYFRVEQTFLLSENLAA